MSNFEYDEENETTTYTEARGAAFYRGEVVLSSEFQGDRVGLCMSSYGGGDSVTVGIGDEVDVQQFLYAAAVRAKLIQDGEPLILMKRIEERDAA
jgi:hypothetical protein